MKKTKLNWKQSDFCENYPIFYAHDKSGSNLLRIELDLMNKSNPNVWNVSILNGFKLTQFKGWFEDADRIKILAEEFLEKTTKNVIEYLEHMSTENYLIKERTRDQYFQIHNCNNIDK